MTRRKPNTKCCTCNAPIYRRPSDIQHHPNGYCRDCKSVAWRLGGRKQAETLYKRYIARWKRRDVNGRCGRTSISGHLRRYMFEKHDGACEKCGWAEVNPTTGKIPLAVHHGDGDFRNNAESNLELLCPNCHSLTPTHGSLNNGRGRPRR